MNTKLILLCLVVGMIVLVGCTKNVYYSTPSTQQNELPPQETAQQTTQPRDNPSPTEERELVKQWMTMYGEYNPAIDEDDLDEAIEFFNSKGLHPIKIYRGSMIFYGESYGYLHVPDYDNDLRTLPPNMSETSYRNLAKKHGGTTTVLPDGNWAASFTTLNQIENFLTEFWAI